MAGMFSRFAASRPVSARFGRWALPPVVLLVAALTSTVGAPRAFAYGDALPGTSRDNSMVFARWVDPAQYFIASNGGFEHGTDNWSVSGDASVVSDNESYAVHGADDANSLSLGTGATAESRTA